MRARSVCGPRPGLLPRAPRSLQQGPVPHLLERRVRHVLLMVPLATSTIRARVFDHGITVCHREKLPREITIVETQEEGKQRKWAAGGSRSPKAEPGLPPALSQASLQPCARRVGPQGPHCQPTGWEKAGTFSNT